MFSTDGNRKLRFSGNYDIPLEEQRLGTVILESSDCVTIFSIKKSRQVFRTACIKCAAHVFYTFSFVWFLLHWIYPIFHILLSSQSPKTTAS